METKLTAKMNEALEIARRDGAVCAGANVSPRGSLERVNASTIQALANRGLLVLFIHPDGGMGGRLPEQRRPTREDMRRRAFDANGRPVWVSVPAHAGEHRSGLVHWRTCRACEGDGVLHDVQPRRVCTYCNGEGEVEVRS